MRKSKDIPAKASMERPTPQQRKKINASLFDALALGKHDEFLDALAAGADVEARNAVGEKPLELAAQQGDARAIAALIQAGADVDAVTGSGWSASMLCAQEGAAEGLRLLLDAGADPLLQINYGGCALSIAVDFDRRACIDELIRRRAGLDLRNAKGHSAAWRAVESLDWRSLAALAAAGADFGGRDSHGQSLGERFDDLYGIMEGDPRLALCRRVLAEDKAAREAKAIAEHVQGASNAPAKAPRTL